MQTEPKISFKTLRYRFLSELVDSGEILEVYEPNKRKIHALRKIIPGLLFSASQIEQIRQQDSLVIPPEERLYDLEGENEALDEEEEFFRNLYDSIFRFFSVLDLKAQYEERLAEVIHRNLTKDKWGDLSIDKSCEKISEMLEEKIPNFRPEELEDASKHLVKSLFNYYSGNSKTAPTKNTDVGNIFETECAGKLASFGYSVSYTDLNDQGADLIAEKDDLSYAIQCKKYDRPVGNKAVQEAQSGRGFYETDYAVVVSDSGFTKSAYDLAAKLGVVLISWSDFEKMADICVESE